MNEEKRGDERGEKRHVKMKEKVKDKRREDRDKTVFFTAVNPMDTKIRTGLT